MKKMSIPAINDDDCVRRNSNNEKLHRTSYPFLRNELAIILGQYAEYTNEAGNPWNICSKFISPELKEGLKKNFDPPPQDLNFIKVLRHSSPDICPMCGAPRTSSLDHYLPKEHYPEYTVFSKNLVPACKCNSSKGKKVTGSTAGLERILHPYYDDCLNFRLLTCLIEQAPALPVVSIAVNILPTGQPIDESINFHVEKIVKPSGIIKWLENLWARLWISPPSVILTMPKSIVVTDVEFKDAVIDQLERVDERYGSANNWESVFLHGVINSPGCIAWITNRHNYLVNNP